MLVIFFFNDTATTEIYTLSLHDALPIWQHRTGGEQVVPPGRDLRRRNDAGLCERTTGWLNGEQRLAREHRGQYGFRVRPRSEEHTSELQSRQYLVCRLLLEKKNSTNISA